MFTRPVHPTASRAFRAERHQLGVFDRLDLVGAPHRFSPPRHSIGELLLDTGGADGSRVVELGAVDVLFVEEAVRVCTPTRRCRHEIVHAVDDADAPTAVADTLLYHDGEAKPICDLCG